jgi:FixJ family two-component response regulator
VTDDTAQPILVVIGDERVRCLVGWVLAELDLPTQLAVSWREALVTTNGPPGCIIADLDDVGENGGRVAVLRKSWGGTIPLVMLSRQSDIAERATKLGAVHGLQKPLNGSALSARLMISRTAPIKAPTLIGLCRPSTAPNAPAFSSTSGHRLRTISGTVPLDRGRDMGKV